MTYSDRAEAALEALNIVAAHVRQVDTAQQECDAALADARAQIGALTAQVAGLQARPRRTRIGMSAPRDQWETRLAETGPVAARRLFGQLDSPGSMVSLAASEVQAGRLPVLSFKVPSNDWRGVGDGKYDALLQDLGVELAKVPGEVFVCLHHEPAGDGAPADYAHMQRRALRVLGDAGPNVLAGVIVNGFWFSSLRHGLTDAQVAEWLPPDVLALCDVVASDCYHGGTTADPGEGAAPKITGMSGWATRQGLTRLGLGEWNGLTAAAITEVGDAIAADPRFEFALVFNSDVNNRDGVSWVLQGDRLDAFRSVRDRFNQ